MTHIIILLSTYNGEAYLREQIESILNQTIPADLILIRDDGSSDQTLAILKEFEQKHSCITILRDSLGHLGLKKSYSALLQTSKALNPQFVMFADQDDVWFSNKNELLLNKINQFDSATPVLVFSDVKIVDSHLKPINSSYINYQKINPKHATSLKSLLLYCPALGCSMIFNQSLLNLVTPMTDEYPNHDKWILLIAALHAEIGYVNTPTLLYRQHEKNVAGALQGRKRTLSIATIPIFIKKRFFTSLKEALIYQEVLPNLDENQRKAIENYIQLFTTNRWLRLVYYFKFYHHIPHWKRKIGLFLSLFFVFTPPG